VHNEIGVLVAPYGRVSKSAILSVLAASLLAIDRILSRFAPTRLRRAVEDSPPLGYRDEVLLRMTLPVLI
jgi:hypothetical protein